MTPSAQMRLLLTITLTTLLGCGYGWIRPDQAPLSRISVGTVEDTSAQGDLGLLVAQVLRTEIAHRRRPLLDPKAPALGGVVRVATTNTLAYGLKTSALQRTEVSVTLILREQGAPRYTGAAVSRTAVWPRAATPVQTRDQRRLAMQLAAQEAATEALTNFLEYPLETP